MRKEKHPVINCIKSLLLFINIILYIGTILYYIDPYKDFTFIAIAITDSKFSGNNIFLDQKPGKSHDDHSLIAVQEEQRVNNCPPKPVPSAKDFTMEKNKKHLQPIRIVVPTIANTGASLLIEGSGFISFEQVRIELSVNWISSLPELNGRTLIYCKMIEADSLGDITTKIQLPKTPLNTTTGIGKYSIIGMDSREEKTASATFISSKTQIYAPS